MKKLIPVLLVILLCCGCIVWNEDDHAERAVAAWKKLSAVKSPQKLNLTTAVSTAQPHFRNAVRREFARLHMAEKLLVIYRKNKQTALLRQAILDRESARINLNCRLGFPPGAQIVYDTAGAFDVPDELPTVENMAKKALLTAGKGEPPLEVLRRVHLAHAAAVAAYDAAAHADSPAGRIILEYKRFLSCLELTGAAGISLLELGDVDASAGRFDAAGKSRRQQ